MKLKELLEQKETDQIVKIGTEGGTAFFYCGTVGEFLDNLDTIDEQMRHETESSANRERRSFMKTIVDGFHWEGNAAAKEKQNTEEDKTFDAWTDDRINEATLAVRKAFNDWLALVAVKKASAVEAERLKVEKGSLGDREVKDVFTASDIVEPEPTICIMIHGFEYGKFWMKEEADAAKAEKNKKQEVK